MNELSGSKREITDALIDMSSAYSWWDERMAPTPEMLAGLQREAHIYTYTGKSPDVIRYSSQLERAKERGGCEVHPYGHTTGIGQRADEPVVLQIGAVSIYTQLGDIPFDKLPTTAKITPLETLDMSPVLEVANREQVTIYRRMPL